MMNTIFIKAVELILTLNSINIYDGLETKFNIDFKLRVIYIGEKCCIKNYSY